MSRKYNMVVRLPNRPDITKPIQYVHGVLAWNVKEAATFFWTWNDTPEELKHFISREKATKQHSQGITNSIYGRYIYFHWRRVTLAITRISLHEGILRTFVGVSVYNPQDIRRTGKGNPVIQFSRSIGIKKAYKALMYAVHNVFVYTAQPPFAKEDAYNPPVSVVIPHFTAFEEQRNDIFNCLSNAALTLVTADEVTADEEDENS